LTETKLMTTNRIAIDTNVLVYIIDAGQSKKHEIAKLILVESPVISTQVVSEFLNVARRKINKPKHEILKKCMDWLSFGEIICVNFKIITKSAELIEKYDFQLFDAIIIASALEARCKILYSEDFQHKQIVEDQLTIINPFI
jgi:predicted nucleic acid-binding protein